MLSNLKVFLHNLFQYKKQLPEINVYFISGMCYNCKVFDKLTLPKGYKKKYIEWLIPEQNETLTNYTKRLSANIDSSQRFIIIGYSFGAVIMQEMTKILKPYKCIIISSFKKETEIPTLFKVAKFTNLLNNVPDSLFSSTKFITNTFNETLFHMSTNDLSMYMTMVDPIYIKWAVQNITNWVPNNTCKHLYHIHGTKDQIFPYDLIKGAFPIDGGDHLMVIKKANEVSNILDQILLIKEE